MKLRYLSFACGIGLALAPSCGGDSQRLAGRETDEAGAGGEANQGDGGINSGGSSVNGGKANGGSGGSQSGGASGSTPGGEAGIAGLGGDTAGGNGAFAGGAGGSDGVAGEAGAGGSSTLDTSGGLEGTVTLSGESDLSTDALADGRGCAEAPAYSITALSARGATLAQAPDDGCLAAGDEVLLINLQGTEAAYANTGNWELLKLENVDGTAVTFTSSKLRSYGSGENSDSDLGTSVTSQRVALVRVPHFESLTIQDGATLTAEPWSGTVGGVVALRADTLQVDGVISAATLGYRGGRWSRDDFNCSDNLATEAGESISGLGTATTTHNVGASGGLGAFTGVSYNANSPICASAGHALAGEVGFNPNSRALGEPGAVYGADDASKLTLGSGPGGNVTCDSDVGREPYLTDFDIRAGGIVLLLVGKLTVGATGTITATPPDPSRDVAPSGGYVYVRGTTLSLGDKRVTAQGAYGRSVNGPAVGQFNHAGAGYVVLSGAVTGTTDPAAKVLP